MIFFSPGTFLTSFLLQIQTQSLAELFRQLIGTKQEEAWAQSLPGPQQHLAPQCWHEGAGQHYACISARRRAQTLKLQKIELKPVNEIQSGCRAVIRSSGCSISPCKEKALSPSPLQPVALLTHELQDSNTPIPVPSSMVASLLPCDLQLHPSVECIQLQGRKRPPCCIAAHRHVSLRPRAILQRAMVPCCMPGSMPASLVTKPGKQSASWREDFMDKTLPRYFHPPGCGCCSPCCAAALACPGGSSSITPSRARLTRAELFPAAGNQPQCSLSAAFITEKSLPAA